MTPFCADGDQRHWGGGERLLKDKQQWSRGIKESFFVFTHFYHTPGFLSSFPSSRPSPPCFLLSCCSLSSLFPPLLLFPPSCSFLPSSSCVLTAGSPVTVWPTARRPTGTRRWAEASVTAAAPPNTRSRSVELKWTRLWVRLTYSLAAAHLWQFNNALIMLTCCFLQEITRTPSASSAVRLDTCPGPVQIILKDFMLKVQTQISLDSSVLLMSRRFNGSRLCLQEAAVVFVVRWNISRRTVRSIRLPVSFSASRELLTLTFDILRHLAHNTFFYLEFWFLNFTE